MDTASIIGFISGIGFVVGGILISRSVLLFYNLLSVVIIVGGTIATTLIAYPLKEFLGVAKTSIKVLMIKIEQPENLIKILVDTSNKARN